MTLEQHPKHQQIILGPDIEKKQGGLETIPGNQSIEEMIRKSLKGHDISPDDSTYYGFAANLNTSDDVSPLFYGRLRSHNPDGYVVGIGAGGILALLNGFTPENPPKGLIMADINPHVVATGRILTQRLREIDNPDALVYAMFRMKSSEYEEYLRLEGEKDEALKRGMERWEIEPLQPYIHGYKFDHPQKRDVPHIPTELSRNFEILRKLAVEGKIATLYTRFQNPNFIEAVKSLPDFSTSRNIIYTTNSIDLIKGPDGIKDFEDLTRYDNEQFPPIFVTSPASYLISLQIARSFQELRLLNTY